MKVLIPVTVQNQIEVSITNDFNFEFISELQKIKLNKLLVTLWFFIYVCQKRDDKIFNFKGFTSIHIKDLKKFKITINKTTYNYNFLLQMLINSKLIDRNNKYCVDKFPKSYRINTSILNGNYEEIEIDYDKLIYKLKSRKHWVRKYPNHKNHIKNSYDIRIDLPNYALWLRRNMGIYLKPIIKNGIVINRKLTDERIFDYLNTALQINLGSLWFKVSHEGRFYNTITNMSYTALPFVTLKGKELKEIDVKNCQPLLLATIIDNEKYQQDVENGQFYENIAKELNTDRNNFKILSYKYIFFANQKLKSGKIYEALNKLYPGFIEKLNKLRNQINISRKLQELEATIMVDRVGSQPYKMMLRHDAVFVYDEDFDKMCEVVKEEFKKIGLQVQIK